jgi:hypothetical protein
MGKEYTRCLELVLVRHLHHDSAKTQPITVVELRDEIAMLVPCRFICRILVVHAVVNMPRYGCYSQARIAIQLGRYQKDLGSV